jgi:hypothetical protein
MTVNEFNRMDEEDQLKAVWDGVFIADRDDEEHAILLYQIDGFYVEVYYHKKYFEVRKLRWFSSTNYLEPYLEKIDLNGMF